MGVEGARELDLLATEIQGAGVTVLCGAGVSKNAGLPLVSELLPAIFQGLDASSSDRELLGSLQLPFEAFMEVLQSNSSFEPLLEIFALGAPCTAHLFLAKLARDGLLRTIATTNFDRLLETALQKELPPGQGFSVAHDESSWRSSPPSSALRVLKLHGTIDDRASLAITIRSVAAKVRSAWRDAAIREIFGADGAGRQSPDGSRTNLVLILGYSCSDVFDLMPSIQSVPEPKKRVVLVRHSEREVGVRIGWEKAGPHFGRYSGQLIQCNTDVLVEHLWRRLLRDEYSKIEQDTAWYRHVQRWASKLERASKHHILGALLTKASQFARAQAHYDVALELRGEGACDRSSVELSLNVAENLRAMGQAKESVVRARECLTKARTLVDRELQLASAVEIGAALHALGDFNGALSSYQEGMGIVDQLKDDYARLQMLGRIAAAHRHLGQPRAALQGYRAACEAASQSGDKWAELANLINLAACQRDLDEQSAAIDVLERASGLARDLGDVQGEMLCLGNLGNCYHDGGRTREAVECYESVRAIASRIDDRLALGTVLGDLGCAKVEVGETESGIQLLESATAIAREIGDMVGEAVALGHLAAVYARTGSPQQAIELYRRAVTIARDMRATVQQGVHLANLADVYLQIDDRVAALRSRWEALGLLEQQLGPLHPKVRFVRQKLVTDETPADAEAADGQTALHAAAIDGSSAAVVSGLATGVDPSAADALGWCALHHAARFGRGDIVDALLQGGANANAVTDEGASPLHLAAAQGATEVVLSLLRSGGRIDLRDSNGAPPLHDAVDGGHYETTLALLEAGADANAANEVGWRPLHIAARGGHERIVELLLGRGAVPHVATRKGSTARDLALRHGHAAVAALLADTTASRAPSGGPGSGVSSATAGARPVNLTPGSGAEADRATAINIEYQQSLAEWEALPWWKRLSTKKPDAPRGI